VIYDLQKVTPLIKVRKGEGKLGEHMEFLSKEDTLETALLNSNAKYVLFGIPEDIGVIGNYGKPGARDAWLNCLPHLLNVQNNKFVKGKNLLLLGHLNFEKELQQIDAITDDSKIEKARELTAYIDTEVTDLVRQIVQCGKIPIVIGGGHNNAYGIIKGTALAYNTAINCLNVDAHSDFRKREGRHSGNGFTYAFREGFLNQYFIMGLHENYNSKKVFKSLKAEKRIRFNTLEELYVRKEKEFDFELHEAINFVRQSKFGIEVDMDSIAHAPSSAQSSSGFQLNQVREIVNKASGIKNVAYLHICEAAPNLDTEDKFQLGKALSYLIIDFIRK
jgi:formiminoglutamase